MLTAFVKNYKTGKQKKERSPENKEVNIVLDSTKEINSIGVSCDNGITILEALSATGLRSIRYAKEVPGIKEIIANDISQKAVEDIKHNIIDNKVEGLVTASFNDAM